MSAQSNDRRRVYFPHVEGLRGFAAAYVFIYHLRESIVRNEPRFDHFKSYTPFLSFGHYCVAIFIVISGYCLAAPVVRRGLRTFDAAAFGRRRLVRIYPAYFAALILATACYNFWATPHFHHAAPARSLAFGLVTHVLLIHNLSVHTIQYINGPMWSVGVESQIYVLFALLLVPIWKRSGVLAQLVVACAVGLAPHFLLHGALDSTCPWFFGLFAMGVAAAHFASNRRDVKTWRYAAAAAFVVAVASIITAHATDADFFQNGQYLVSDCIVGAAVALFFVAAIDDEGDLWSPARFLSSPVFVRVGTFAYSLYLLHLPMILVMHEILRRAHASTLLTCVAYASLVPVVIVFSHGFYLLFERPFISRFLRKHVADDRRIEHLPMVRDAV